MLQALRNLTLSKFGLSFILMTTFAAAFASLILPSSARAEINLAAEMKCFLLMEYYKGEKVIVQVVYC